MKTWRSRPTAENQHGDIGQRLQFHQGPGLPHGGVCGDFYDKSTGDVWCKYHWDREEWTVYHDADVIKVGITTRYKSQQQIADMIADAMADYEQTERENAIYLAGGTQS